MDLVDKLYQRLVAAVDAADEGAFPGGITVADVYQRLIPYRAVRGQLGVVELAEYEHALLRLLAGERHYLEVGDSSVRLELQRELASLNPILGIYRDYSAAKISFGTGPEGQGGAGPSLSDSGLPAESPSAGEVAEDPGDEIGPPRLVEAIATAGESETEDTLSARPTEARTSEACGGCGRLLPDLPDLLFCPFCGRSVTPAPCAHCGAPMEREWSFCARCGTARSGGEHSRSTRTDG